MKILLIIIAINLSYYQQDTPRTQHGIWSECVKQKVLYPDIAVRISTTETQCGTTGVGKSRNNIFGFRNKSGYLYFDSIRDCISYYKRWQDRKYPKHLEVAHKSSECDYYHFIESVGWKMGKPYSAAERKYINYLKKIKLNFND